MKKINKKTFVDKSPRKVRNRLNQSEVFYTYPHWDKKDIEGVKFLAVVKNLDSERLQQIYYVREDNMEFVK
jgi:hypothetical protein